MRIALAFSVVMVTAGLAAAQSYPDLELKGARPDIWPLITQPQAPKPVFVVDGYTKRTEAFDHEGQKSAEEITRSYDPAGHLLAVRKLVEGKLETASTMSYDAKGRVLHRIDEYSTGSKYTYDFSYDAAGRLSKLSDVGPDRPAQEMVLSYDAAGNLASRAETSDGKTGTTRFIRSKHGTLVGIAIDGADGKHSVLYDGSDDASGNVVRVKTGAWMAGEEAKATWDAKHRLTSFTSTRDKVISVVKVSYDAAGRIVSLRGETTGPTDSSTTAVDAKYDAAGHLLSLSESTTRQSGPPPGKGKPKGPTPGGFSSNEVRNTTYTYDAKGHVVSEHEDFGGGGGGHGFNSKADATYSYDAKGRLTQIKRHTEGYPPMHRTDIVTYTY